MSFRLTKFSDDAAMTKALVVASCNALKMSQNGTPQSLLLSGGSSPVAFYTALGAAPLDWSHIHMALVDERWVDADNDGSNTRLINTTLRAQAAGAAPFVEMKTPHSTPQEAAPLVAANYAKLPPIGLSILGMGPDAHTASWFEKAAEYDAVSAADAPLGVAGITAPETSVTGIYLDRITITGSFLGGSAQAFLILKGDMRLSLFEQCMNQDLSASPIGRAAKILGDRLHVFALTGEQ
jgi:6-phosphogluconolactonase